MPSQWKILLYKKAQKELQKISGENQITIARVIERLQVDPLSPGHKKLKGKQTYYHIRFGDCRTIYSLDGQSMEITIIRIAHRSEVYKP